MRKALLGAMIDRGDLPAAGPCKVRMSPGRIFATFHEAAPAGVSACSVCGQYVVRGLGEWWRR